MAQRVIRVRGTKAEILEILRTVPYEARGTGEAAKALLVRMGMELLARIRDAFVTKARGGTDEAGLRWPALSPKTIAYSRRHPGLPPSKQRASKRPSYALGAEQRKAWWKTYAHYLAVYKGDKGHAAAAAWLVAKQNGATTLLAMYGSTSVEILRDTGLLLNSLSPGVQANQDQVFRVGPGEVVVGTNRAHAGAHHRGVPGKLPKRPLWPDPKQWPSSWWAGLLEQGKEGLIDIILWVLSRRAA